MTGYLWAALVYTYTAGTIVTDEVKRFARWVASA